MSKRLFLFNPDCELAIANGSPFYMAPGNIVKMTDDLAYLAAYLAGEGDYVLIRKLPEKSFLERISGILDYACRPVNWEEAGQMDIAQAVPWGWSPKICKQLSGIADTPVWHTDRKEWYSRKKAKELLSGIVQELPFVEKYIVPEIVHSIEEIEQNMGEGEWLVKAPWSSSGRGLLAVGFPLAAKERQWLTGMLRRQGYMMLERKLDRVLDFAMEFQAKAGEPVTFMGLSVFKTGENGEYRGNYIGSQTYIQEQAENYVDRSMIEWVKSYLISALPRLLPEYTGALGVDMMVYRNAEGRYKIQPCVEINLRNNMGIVALEISRKCLAKHAHGYFTVNYYPVAGEAYRAVSRKLQEQPLCIENHRIRSGYLNLTPVNEQTCFVAEIEVKQEM